jgi:hypothetical protein
MPLSSINTRTVEVVEDWCGAGARPTSKHLDKLWTDNKSEPYDDDAKRDLIAKLKGKFKNFKLHLKPSTFSSTSIVRVQDLIEYIERL